MELNGNSWDIAVGDRIQFKAITRADYRAVWRVVNGFTPCGWYEDYDLRKPTVRYHGWADFIVNYHEIITVEQCNE